MIGCIQVSDEYCEDNLSTLQYAYRAAKITNRLEQNMDPNAFLVENLKNRVQELESELRRCNDHIVV
jgi:AAA+ ATPase superfamily predicted ATPase